MTSLRSLRAKASSSLTTSTSAWWAPAPAPPDRAPAGPAWSVFSGILAAAAPYRAPSSAIAGVVPASSVALDPARSGGSGRSQPAPDWKRVPLGAHAVGQEVPAYLQARRDKSPSSGEEEEEKGSACGVVGARPHPSWSQRPTQRSVSMNLRWCRGESVEDDEDDEHHARRHHMSDIERIAEEVGAPCSAQRPAPGAP